MAQIVAAALTSHAPLITGRPEVSRPGASMTRASCALNKALTAVARPHAMKDGLRDEDLAGHELTDAERTALGTGDITARYHLGANPYLIRRVFRSRFRI
jgi:hypothetical protein